MPEGKEPGKSGFFLKDGLQDFGYLAWGSDRELLNLYTWRSMAMESNTSYWHEEGIPTMKLM